MEKGVSKANANRAIRQEALRESLSAGGHIQHVVDIDTKLKLVSKYLPDVKSVEIKNAEGESFKTDGKWTVEFINAEVQDADIKD